MSKVNYHLQTDAIKNHILPLINIPKDREAVEYAKEADIINLAIFGKTAKEWRDENKNRTKTENIRDYASSIELVIISNLEHKNSELIKKGFSQIERLRILTQQANEEKEIFNRSISQNKLLDNKKKE